MKSSGAARLLTRLLKTKHRLPVSLICSLLVVASLSVGGQPRKDLTDPGPRYLTHVTTDKPIYRAGETVLVRAVMLSGATHAPMKSTEGTDQVRVEVRGPRGELLKSDLTKVTDSTAAFTWNIPSNQAGGQYKVRISHPATGNAPAERRFDIRGYRTPRLKSQIVFLRDGYGPGDTVVANLHAERAEGGIPANAKVTIAARVDGEETWSGETTIDSAGNATASFKLPPAIERGEGSIAMIIQDGGVVETAARTIPILLHTLDLSIYPEGGDLIAGLPNRVYIEGKTPKQKPADMTGVVVDAAGREVATFRTEHEGRGRFSFTPERGAKYSLRINEPSGITNLFPLPPVTESGVTLAAVSDVTLKEQPVTVRVTATTPGTYDIVLSKRGKELSSRSVWLRASEPYEVTLPVPKSADGVLATTVYGRDHTPMAERLVFRQPDHGLRIDVATEQQDFVPGDKATLRITTKDDSGKPVSAVVGLTVTDASVLEMIDKRERAPQLPVMALLENDVKDLSDADIYLDETNPKAHLATDLLLGTQGWRRFAAVNPVQFIGANGDAAHRALAANTATIVSSVVRKIQGEGVGDGLITGMVTDHSGAALPGVTMKVTNTDTGATATMQTTDNGVYAFSLKRGSRYSVSAEFTNFQRAEIRGVRLGKTDNVRFDFVLELGTLSQTIIVEADKARLALNRARGDIGMTLDEAEIESLPLVGGDPLSLITTLPGYRASPLCSRGPNDFEIVGASTDPLAAAITGHMVPVPNNCVPWGMIYRGGSSDFFPFSYTDSGGQYIRQYAHSRRSNWTEGSRVDFAETIYWSAAIKTSGSEGRATVSFNLSDSVTSFKVLADGFTGDGTLGAAVGNITSKRPFYIEPKIPLEVTSGDVIQLPVSFVNGLDRNLRDVDVTGSAPIGLQFIPTSNNAIATLRANERDRRILQVNVNDAFQGVTNLVVTGKTGPYRDTVNRVLTVRPLGFPRLISTGGILESNGSRSFEFTLPAETVGGSVSSSVMVYPTPLASMTEALRSLLQEPHGCFEQTSSTSYPMVMAQQYFLTHSGVDHRIIEQAKELLDASYKRLISFESPKGGFEWYGKDPGHEGLTAYGLMQFTDMSQVRNVDQSLINRTRSWLLSRRDDEGGFHSVSAGFNGIGHAPLETTNAYITWALVESGATGLEREITSVKALAHDTNDSYIIALAANILLASGARAGARPLMDKLAGAQDPRGDVKGAVTSITQSAGFALNMETTALALLAWMREPAYTANAERGLRWIAASNQAGRFGSTQATVLALRAIVAYDATYSRLKAPGHISLIVDGKPIGKPVAFTANTQGAIAMPDLGGELGPGTHTIALRMEDGFAMPFSMAVKYHNALPDSALQTQIGIRVVLKDQQIREGGVTEATVSITNKRDHILPTPVAIIGIPGGLEVRHDQLKELVSSGKIDAYEVNGREVVLYWRYIKPAVAFDVPLSLIAAVPGSYTGAASRAYLYYVDEHKEWAPGIKVNITP